MYTKYVTADEPETMGRQRPGEAHQGPLRPRRFLYEHVAAELRRRIAKGVYAPGTRIPSEAELVREFGVSAITIRRTLRDLRFEGLLIGRQGLGVFVADARRIRRSLTGDPIAPIRDEIRRAGITPGVKQTALSLVPGDLRTAGTLGLEPGALLYRLETVILADAEPVGLETVYLRRELGDTLREELSREFLYPLLMARGVPIDHLDFQIEGASVAEDEAPQLGLPVGFPAVVVHHTAIAPDGTAAFMGRTITRADRFVYELCRRPEVHRSPRPVDLSPDGRTDRGPRRQEHRPAGGRAPG